MCLLVYQNFWLLLDNLVTFCFNYISYKGNDTTLKF